MNGLVESLAVQRFQALVLGVAPHLTTGALRFFPSEGTLRWRKGPEGELEECFDLCDRPQLTAGGEPAFADTYRWADPNLTEALETGALNQENAGVVEPAPSAARPEPSRDPPTDKRGSVIDWLRSLLPSA